MPRGGGFSGGGGGFRGGSFGGGFSGGGFKGGSSSFRSSSFGTSPSFGRTGANRISSSSNRGPYSRPSYTPRNYYHHPYGYHRPYWGWNYWYRPHWLWGYHYRPWYYSPVYVGGGAVLFIIMLLIFLPLMGVLIAYPFSSGSSDGTVKYNATETLNFNEYWYEYENMKAGGQITYRVQSSPNPISFMIADHPMSQFPVKTLDPITIQESFELEANEYIYAQQFLYYTSTIQYSFTASASIDFLIVDGDNAGYWNNNEYYTADAEETGQSGSGSAIAKENKDYYSIFYNPSNAKVNITTTITYIIKNVPNFSNALVVYENVTNVPQATVDIPSDGNWYFFVFFDPVLSEEYDTMITFDVTYKTGVTSVDQWSNARGGLIVVAIIIIGIIALAAVARKQQKTKGDQQTTTPSSTTTTSTPQTPTTIASQTPSQPQGSSTRAPLVTTQYQSTPLESSLSSTTKQCHACNATVSSQAIFCQACGAKQEGRAFGKAPVQPKAQLQFCYYCGGKIEPGQKYCAFCGAKTDRE